MENQNNLPQQIGQQIEKCRIAAKTNLSALTDEEIETRRRNRQAAALWEQCGIGERHRRMDVAELKKHAKFTEKFMLAENIVNEGGIVLVFGDRGSGKTQLGVELVRSACQQLKGSRYIHCRQIGMKLREAFKNNATITEAQAVENFARPKLLVIDECQERMESDFEYRSLTLILDLRYADLKSTVLIGNCNEQQYIEFLGSSIIDRAKEGGGSLCFDWKSFRGQTG